MLHQLSNVHAWFANTSIQDTRLSSIKTLSQEHKDSRLDLAEVSMVLDSQYIAISLTFILATY